MKKGGGMSVGWVGRGSDRRLASSIAIDTSRAEGDGAGKGNGGRRGCWADGVADRRNSSILGVVDYGSGLSIGRCSEERC